MNRDELIEEVQTLLAQILKIKASEVKEGSNLQNDLGLDSVDFWDAMASFRKKFKINVAESEVVSLKTVGDLVDLLEKKKSNK